MQCEETHRSKSLRFHGVTLFGALVKLNGPVFWSVGQFLDVTIPQILVAKLQPRLAVSIEFFLKCGTKCLKIEQSHPVLPYAYKSIYAHILLDYVWNFLEKYTILADKVLWSFLISPLYRFPFHILTSYKIYIKVDELVQWFKFNGRMWSRYNRANMIMKMYKIVMRQWTLSSSSLDF